jgi:hypothetical protein
VAPNKEQRKMVRPSTAAAMAAAKAVLRAVMKAVLKAVAATVMLPQALHSVWAVTLEAVFYSVRVATLEVALAVNRLVMAGTVAAA